MNHEWTSEKPTEPGWYWVARSVERIPVQILEIISSRSVGERGQLWADDFYGYQGPLDHYHCDGVRWRRMEDPGTP